MPEAKKAALKALALDETVAEAHAALGFVLHFYDWDWAGAELEYRRALELNPEEPQARRSYPVLLVDLGRVEESVAEARSSVERDPVSAFYRYILAHVLTLARRFEEVIAEARAGFEFDPSFHLFYNALGLGLAGLGRRDDTVEVSRQGEVAAPGVPLVQAQLGWALGLAGERREALAILEDLKRRRSEGYFSGVLVAWVCVGLGDHDQAIAWLQQAGEERDGLMAAHLNKLLVFDPLRSDPRFQALLQRMNFPAEG